MRVDDRNETAVFRAIGHGLSQLLARRPLAIVLYTIAILLLAAVFERTGLLASAVRKVRLLPVQVVQLVDRLTVKPESITIDLGFMDQLRIEYQRERALANGFLVTSPDDMVPATVRYRDRSIPVRLRLKGDLPDHWKTDKWSFRIRTRGDRTLFGMKQFSIQRPDTRNFLFEWLFHRALRREGLIGLRYLFVDVTVNGEAKGIYALEEHFDKRLPENNLLREGPIVRFNEDLFWTEIRDHGGLPRRHQGSPTGTGSFLASEVDGFGSSRWLEDETRRDQYVQAVQLLEGFRHGELAADDVFEVRKFGTFLALCDLFRAQHAAHWRNIRFYFNPLTSRLEPIGFDGTQIGERMWGIVPELPYVYEIARFHPQFYEPLFGDAELYREYIAALERVSDPDYLAAFLTELGDEIERNTKIVQRDYPKFTFDTRYLDENRQHIRAVLRPVKSLQAYLGGQASGEVELQLGNLHILPVEILGVRVGETWFPETTGPVLRGRSPQSLVEYETVSFALPGVGWEGPLPPMTVRYRLLGTGHEVEEPVRPYPPRADDLRATLTRRAPNWRTFDFIREESETRRLRVAPGKRTVAEDLVIPAGYTLVVEPGTEIELTRGASIVSRARLEWLGEPERPIVVRSEAGASGVFVLEAEATSLLEHVVFQGLAAPLATELGITGAVTFYEAPVTIRNARFIDARAEDALNLVRSPFSITESAFIRSGSDALDVDFSDGDIVRCLFDSPVNDGIDASGSAVTLRDVRIRGARDKAISVGESSRLSGSGITVEASKVAVASKDLSEVRLSDVRITDSEIGLAAYQKKPEFGPSMLEVLGLHMGRVRDPYWVEVRSRVILRDGTIEGTRHDPGPVFYPEG